MRAYLSATGATLAAGLAARPDALVLDAHSLGQEGRPDLPAAAAPALLIRLGEVEDAAFAAHLAAAMPFAPRAIVLPVRHGRDLAHAGARLAVEEAEHGLPDGATGIVALIGNAAGALDAASLVGASPRLCGVGWDAAALAAETGIARACEAGFWAPPLALARSAARLAAAAAGVEAIETACPDGADRARHVADALRDGFGAVLAADVADVAVIRSAEAGTVQRSLSAPKGSGFSPAR